MSSAECKEAIIEYFDTEGIETQEADWKRVSKNTVTTLHGNKESLRLFENAVAGASAWTLGDDEDASILEAGDLLYDVGHADGETYLNFAPEVFWLRNNHLPDQHIGDILKAAHGLANWMIEDEACENNFVIDSKYSVADIHREMASLGIKHADFTSAGPAVTPAVGGVTVGEVGRHSPRAISVLSFVIKLFEDEDTTKAVENGEISLRTLVDGVFDEAKLNTGERDALYGDLTKLFEEYGIPDFNTSYFAEADRDNVLGRLKMTAADRHSHMPAGSLAGSEKDVRPDIDVTEIGDNELYRMVLRGEVPQISTIGFFFDEKKTGPATEDELAWYCGYLGRDYKLMKDRTIPDKVFENIFAEYRKATFNDYEDDGMISYHTMPVQEKYAEGIRSIITQRLTEMGFRNDDTIVNAPLPPLLAIRTAAPVTPAVVHHAPVVPVVATSLPSPTVVPAVYSTAHDTTASKKAFTIALTEKTVICFVCGEVDEEDELLASIPADDVFRLFPEYEISQMSPGSFKVTKMFGEDISALENKVKSRLLEAGMVDSND